MPTPISNRFPYSEPYGTINYMRNPVKVVLNAYDGTMTFYVVDESEPIAAAYRKIFPSLFKPFARMPESSKNNIRYPPMTSFDPGGVYRTYHPDRRQSSSTTRRTSGPGPEESSTASRG